MLLGYLRYFLGQRTDLMCVRELDTQFHLVAVLKRLLKLNLVNVKLSI